MSQKQAISQTPIDLKAEDEARAKGKAAAAPAEVNAGAQPGDIHPVPGRDQQQPNAGRASEIAAARRIQDGGDKTVQISSPGQPTRPAAQNVLPPHHALMFPRMTTCPPSEA